MLGRYGFMNAHRQDSTARRHYCRISMPKRKVTDSKETVVRGFGEEWEAFDHGSIEQPELESLFDAYFKSFPWKELPPDAVGFDAGSGSGRWASLVAPRVKTLHLIDASAQAMSVARARLAGSPNARFHVVALESAGSDDLGLVAGCDFGYCLGVLHHLEDPLAGLVRCVALLKPGAPFLVYVYHALEHLPRWQRAAWHFSDVLRRGIARLPRRPRLWLTGAIALTVYLPLSRIARLIEVLGFDPSIVPLAAYRHRSLYVLRNDAFDRFGTSVEKRFTRVSLVDMLTQAGLDRIEILDGHPWLALGYRENFGSHV
jgi:SAM-dependent methyltransferase